MDKCLYEERWGRVLTQLEYMASKFTSHVTDGEKQGGYRDRLVVAEQDIKSVKKEISALKKSEWTRVLVAGLIGGLTGNLTPEFLTIIVRFIGLK